MNTESVTQPASVLVLDHDLLFVQLITRMFRGQGWHAQGFASPQAVLDGIGSREVQPDLVIANLDGPDTSQAELVDWLRQRNPSMTCLLLSENHRIRPLHLPERTGFMHKPVRPSRLLASARALLQGRLQPAG